MRALGRLRLRLIVGRVDPKELAELQEVHLTRAVSIHLLHGIRGSFINDTAKSF